MSQDENSSELVEESKPNKTKTAAANEARQDQEEEAALKLRVKNKQILPTNKLNSMPRPVGDYYCCCCYHNYYCRMARNETRRKSESSRRPESALKLAQDSHQSQHYYSGEMRPALKSNTSNQLGQRLGAALSLWPRLNTTNCHRRANSSRSSWPATANWLLLTFGLLFLVRMSYLGLNVAAVPGDMQSAGSLQTIEPAKKWLEDALQQQQQQQQESGHRRHQISKRAEMDDASRPEVSATNTSPTTDDDQLEAADSAPGAGLLNGAQAAPIKQQPQGASTKLHIVRLFAPDSIQNGTQDVTIDCMFKYDKKLDQRLAIKWYFNDEQEPIYQWIPELNKRVYSDKYERFIDKQYQVNEDVDFMLQAYKLLTTPAGDQERDWDRASALNNHQHHRHQPTTTTTASGEAELNADNLPLDSNSILVASGRRRSADNTANRRAKDDEEIMPDDDPTAAPTEDDQKQVVASRKLLANRLNRLAKLGSDHSRQLLGSLRSVLAMDSDEVSKFRALRLVRPTVEMDGRYTCSISSLDGDDLQSTRLIVYEPPRSFTFNVTKSAGQMYNLTCQAGPTYPRPSLALYRYRAGQLEAQQQQPGAVRPTAAVNSQDLRSDRHAHRPRLAATTLKQEPLAGTQVQLKISAKRQPTDTSSLDSMTSVGGHKPPVAELNDDSMAMITMANSSAGALPRINLDLDDEPPNEVDQHQPATSPYEISAWALVDEASLSSNLVTQFECVLTIDGANYEQRQSLALQKGWHVNSSALTAKSTLVGLMSVLAAFLCLTVALVSAILIFKLLRRHANKSTRVHQQVATSKRHDVGKHRLDAGSGRGRPRGDCEANSSSASTSPSDVSASTMASGGANANGGATADGDNQSISSTGLRLGTKHGSQSARNQLTSSNAQTLADPGQRNSIRLLSGGAPNRMQPQASSRHVQQSIYQQPQPQVTYSTQADQEQHQSDGIYRVPENRSSFGTRYMAIGNNHLEQQQAIWSTSYGPLGGSPAATSRHQQDYKSDEPIQANFQQHQQNYYHPNGQAQVSNNNRGMLTTNQLAAIGGGGGQKLQHRPQQPATISVNGKQLYC